MSSISIDVPSLEINQHELQNFVSFIYRHEQLLKEYGAIKIQPNNGCKLALKKRRKNMVLCPITEQIAKMSKDKLIYSVRKIDHTDESIRQNSLVTDECSFWSSLSCSSNERRHVNISLLPNKSFFSEKTSRFYFDIHRLPNQSLLKLGGRKVTRQFVPYIRRAHGPGAIFALASAQQRLFSLNYHHEGGAHHWYIIPNREREILRRIVDRDNSSICLDHGRLLIDPSVLDKNHIRYHRIVQRPNEFVVLSAGTLAQSFTEDASWSESIAFALPSWIEEAHACVSIPQCQCDIPYSSSLETVDVSLFRHELIQRYITSHLTNITDGCNDVDQITIPTSDSMETNSSSATTIIPPNMELTVPLQPTMPCFQAPQIPVMKPSISSYFLQEGERKYADNNDQIQYKLLDEGHFCDASERKKSDSILIGSISRKNAPKLDIRASQLCPTTTTYNNIRQDVTNNCSADGCCFLFEELMDLLPPTTDTTESKFRQADEDMNMSIPSTPSSKTGVTVTDERSYVKKEQAIVRTKTNRNALFVSGLRKNVNTHDLRSHFTGCIKVTIKQYRTTPHLKYAFVLHRTYREAKHNLQRPIDRYLLGHQCCVEFANACSTLSSDQQNFDRRKIVVSRIPENVDENDLRHLFNNGHILKYCPARNIHRPVAKVETKNKILSGCAIADIRTKEPVIQKGIHTAMTHMNSLD